MNGHTSSDQVSDLKTSLLNKKPSPNTVAQENFDKEKLAIKEVSEILTHLPDIAHANIPISAASLNNEENKESDNEDSSNGDDISDSPDDVSFYTVSK